MPAMGTTLRLLLVLHSSRISYQMILLMNVFRYLFSYRYVSIVLSISVNHETNVCLTTQTSTSFFTVQRSPVKLAQTLGASCGVNFDTCSTLMASLARQIQSPNNCAADLQNQNPMVVQAYTGFVAYQSLYHAGCLLNDDTGSYCEYQNFALPTSTHTDGPS